MQSGSFRGTAADLALAVNHRAVGVPLSDVRPDRRYHAESICSCRPSKKPFARFATALAEQFGRPGAKFERREPFEAMSRVMLDRELARVDARPPVLAAPDGSGICSRRSGWPRATCCEIRDKLLEKGVRPRPFLIAPLRHLARVDRRAPRRPGRFAVQSRSIDRLAAGRAGVGYRGISVAAADAILLYALKRPSYPVDRATFRRSRSSRLARSVRDVRRGPRNARRTRPPGGAKSRTARLPRF